MRGKCRPLLPGSRRLQMARPAGRGARVRHTGGAVVRECLHPRVPLDRGRAGDDVLRGPLRVRPREVDAKGELVAFALLLRRADQEAVHGSGVAANNRVRVCRAQPGHPWARNTQHGARGTEHATPTRPPAARRPTHPPGLPYALKRTPGERRSSCPGRCARCISCPRVAPGRHPQKCPCP